MSTDLSPHLNDEQFAECAAGGMPDPAIVEHLAACEACRAEVDAFRLTMESFNTESLAWSEAQPAESLRSRVPERKPQPVWVVASWALAGCLALLSALSVATHRGEQRNNLLGKDQLGISRPPATPDAGDSPAQIERDNRLLSAVYEATSTRASSPLLEYGLEAPSPARTKGRSFGNDND